MQRTFREIRVWKSPGRGAIGCRAVHVPISGAILSETLRSDPQALEVKVVGQQWSWRFEYPDSGIVSTELVLPVNKQTLLHLSSTDVIHSFWVPEFRVKQDALPGGPEFVRDLRITPTIVGEYKVRCAELCGVQHAYMEAPVKIVSQANYEAWVNEQTGPSDDPVATRQEASKAIWLYRLPLCGRQQKRLVNLERLYGHDVPLVDGQR